MSFEGRNRLGLCMICSKEGKKSIGKYCCPACDFVTCSLACVKQHKRVDKCSGVRNLAKMVKKRDYNEANLVSDYSLMEDTTRVLGSAKVCKNDVSAKESEGRIPKGVEKRLVNEALRRNIQLSFMPSGMVRHRRNTTQIKSVPKSRFESVRSINGPKTENEAVDAGTARTGTNNQRHGNGNGNRQPHNKFQLLFWHVDLYLGKELVKVEHCAEDTKLDKIVSVAVAKRSRKRKRCWDASPISISSADGEGEAEGGDKCDDGRDLLLFLQNEYSVQSQAGGSNRFSLLNKSCTLGDVLRGKTIVEYPVLYAVRPADSAEVARFTAAKFGVFEKPEAVSEQSSDSSDDESVSSDEEEGEIKEEGIEIRRDAEDGRAAKQARTSADGNGNMNIDIAMGKEVVRKSRFSSPLAPVAHKAANVTLPGAV